VIGDMLGSVGAIAAALIMLGTGWYLADPLLSACIGLLILWSSWRLVRESTEVLLESTPAHIDAIAVRREMTIVPGVTGVHDLHIWTVTSGLVALSGHVECDAGQEWNDVLIELAALLRERFDISHVTLQPEMGNLPAALAQCTLDTPEGRRACLSHHVGVEHETIAPDAHAP
jgi:cobalt-zinc-cadmium efflux system protein